MHWEILNPLIIPLLTSRQTGPGNLCPMQKMIQPSVISDFLQAVSAETENLNTR